LDATPEPSTTPFWVVPRSRHDPCPAQLDAEIGVAQRQDGLADQPEAGGLHQGQRLQRADQVVGTLDSRHPVTWMTVQDMPQHRPAGVAFQHRLLAPQLPVEDRDMRGDLEDLSLELHLKALHDAVHHDQHGHAHRDAADGDAVQQLARP
jgi:hypothetical protein